MADLIALTEYVALTDAGALETSATAYFYEAGTSTPLDVKTDSGLGTSRGTSVALDSEGKLAQCWVTGGQGVKVDIKDALGVSLPGFPMDNFPTHPESAATASDTGFTPVTGNAATDVQTAIANEAARANKAQNFLHIETSGGSSNAYTLTPAVTVSAYSDGLAYTFRANHANTGTATLNVSGVGAVTIQKLDSSNAKTNLVSGDIRIGDVVEVRHDGSNFVLVDVTRADTGEITLTDAATIAWDLSLGKNFTVELTASRTLGAPSNASVGQTGLLRILQDTTGGWGITLNSAYEYEGELLLDETASAETLLRYEVISSSRVALTRIAPKWQEYGPTSLSSTAVDFTSIPTGAKRATVILNLASLSGTDNFLVQMSAGGNFVTSGYDSISSTFDSSGSSSTAGQILLSGVAASVITHTMVLEKEPGSDTWVQRHTGRIGSGSYGYYGSGEAIDLGAALDGIRVTRTGTNTFDGGTVSAIVEY